MLLSKREKKFTLFFSIIVLSELITGSFKDLALLHYFTKPLILASLIVFFLAKSKLLSKDLRNLTLLALIFSLIGDILLMFVNNTGTFFIGGLVSFLLAHIIYIILFLKKRSNNINPLPIIIILLIYATGIFYFLKDGLATLLIPVIIYIFVILSMAVTAWLRKGMVPKLSYTFVFTGALLFVISDSTLALNKFYQTLPQAHILIMITYAFAQYLIVFGLLKQHD